MCKCELFLFKQKTAYEMRISDWSSDVCSSDLLRVTQREADLSVDQSIALHARSFVGDGNCLLLSRIACREVIEVAASDIGIIGVQLQYAGLKLELLRRADARGPLGSLRDRLARPIHFNQLATDQLILEPASFLVTRMQIGGRAFDRHALPRNERALELQAIGLRVAGVCHELSELRVTFAIDEGRVDDALNTLDRTTTRMNSIH